MHACACCHHAMRHAMQHACRAGDFACGLQGPCAINCARMCCCAASMQVQVMLPAWCPTQIIAVLAVALNLNFKSLRAALLTIGVPHFRGEPARRRRVGVVLGKGQPRIEEASLTAGAIVWWRMQHEHEHRVTTADATEQPLPSTSAPVQACETMQPLMPCNWQAVHMQDVGAARRRSR